MGSEETDKPGRYQLVALCALCLGISYCDRVNLSVAIVPMSQEYNWDITEKGKLLSGFFYGYMVSQILGAVLSAKFGGDRVLGIAAFFWSLLTILVPLASKFGTTSLFINRILVGIFEGVSFPVVYHLFALNIPDSEKSRSISILSVNVAFGAVFAFYLSPILITHYSWESVFYFFGSLCLIWCLVWFLFWLFNFKIGFGKKVGHVMVRIRLDTKLYDIPNDTNTTITDEFQKSLRTVTKLLNHGPILAILYCHFCHNIGHYVILSWLPTLLDHLGVKGENLSITCIPYILMAIFVLIFGAAADWMIKQEQIRNDEFTSRIRRFWTVWLFSIAAVCIAIVSFFLDGSHLTFVLVFLSIGLGLNVSAPVAGYESAKLELLEKDKVGMLQGISNTFATLSGIIGVPVVSLIHVTFNSWTPVFWWISAMFSSAAFIFHKYGRWEQKIRI